ncbi:MAG: hybrid sensor histidine kinase/response regulator [Magnetococcales bacterium]|nr:hybrid sensor histidine kinase/response regulator [Magnetococcales bacterium]
MNDILPTLLIVDDERLNLNSLVDLFQESYNVLVAKNGKQALARVKGDPSPDLIVLDILMPDMDGFQIAQRLKEDPETARIPIIFITALHQEEDQIRGFELGAVDFITKPFMPSVVKARVETHLSLKSAHTLLEEQNNALVKAAHLKEDVDRIMRHDLKAPLNSIIGIPQLLLEELALEPDQRELLRVVESSGYQMLRMINNSLDLYKMETGSYTLKPTGVDLANIARRILHGSRPLVLSRGLTVGLRIDGEPEQGNESFAVRGEEMLCHAMLANLIQNALEASPDGGAVTIHLESGAERVCRIHNQGVVPEMVQERFFEKYATAGKSQGTGLGTYSAQLMATIMGGTITMQTNPEHGTNVTICLLPGVL